MRFEAVPLRDVLRRTSGQSSQAIVEKVTKKQEPYALSIHQKSIRNARRQVPQ